MVAAAYANARVLQLLADAGADTFAQSGARTDAVSAAFDEPTRRLVLQLRERQVARLALAAAAARLTTHPLFDRRALRATGTFLWGRRE
jgi:ethanolamine ammonia-lyase small subunit